MHRDVLVYVYHTYISTTCRSQYKATVFPVVRQFQFTTHLLYGYTPVIDILEMHCTSFTSTVFSSEQGIPEYSQASYIYEKKHHTVRYGYTVHYRYSTVRYNNVSLRTRMRRAITKYTVLRSNSNNSMVLLIVDHDSILGC